MSKIINNNEINKFDNIKKYLANLNDDPGVYRMLDKNKKVLYVGKAKNLRKRVLQYTKFNNLPFRLQIMVASTYSMEFIYTQTENEALGIEAQLIKTLQPRYNIRLKDDKSHTYIAFRKNHIFPGMQKLRVNQEGKNKKNIYKLFGPFINSTSIDKTTHIINKTFKIRTCSDRMFTTVTRPCLQYHIKQCSAPCVNYINADDYNESINKAYKVLNGEIESITKQLQTQMYQESKQKNYEFAAKYRDQIKAVNMLNKNSLLFLKSVGEYKGLCNVIGIYGINNQFCIEVFTYENGINYGNKVFYPSNCKNCNESDVLEQFFKLFYLQYPLPKYLILSHDISDECKQNLTILQKNITVMCPKIGNKKIFIDNIVRNAKLALIQNKKIINNDLLEIFAKVFSLTENIKKIEVYDNSHISGTNGICAMIAVRENGFTKSEYRKISNKNIKANDDYKAMEYMLNKRFTSSSLKNLALPEVIIIDGGKSHLNVAMKTIDKIFKNHLPLNHLSVNYSPFVIAISKGEKRKDGQETIHLPNNKSISIQSLIQDATQQKIIEKFLINVRDEAHRFAIQGHRIARSREMVKSELDQIKGIGSLIKKRLIENFGNIEKIRTVNIEKLTSVKGISTNLAKNIKLSLQQK